MSFVDKIAENFRKLVSPYKFGGSEYYEMNIPPGWGTSQYLQSYGQIGWLYAAVNVRAAGVAKTLSRWHLYDGEDHENEILNHEILDLLHYMNPFQSSYQFIYLSQMYKDLAGESFWALNSNKGGKPAEIWLAPPTYMQVIPDSENYIKGYKFERGSHIQYFDINEIIQIFKPNPYNPYRGVSPAQALTLDLDSERYAAAYQQKLFFNDATPGMVIEYPAQDMPPAETRRELAMEWEERHKGFRNRGKTAFLWGGKANSITMSNTDMDFKSLRQYSRDVILGVYGVPGSIIGMTENANRAVAETANYSFMFNTILPECIDIREALNENLCPLFGEGLYLDFDNPVPEDEAMVTTNAVNAYKGGLITRNEGRELMGYDEDLERGDVYFSAPAPNPFGSADPGGPEDNAPTADNLTNMPKRKMFNSEADKERHWRSYVTGAEHFEAAFKTDLNKMFTQQKAEALHKFHANPKQGVKLLDKTAFKSAYKDAAKPSMTNAMLAAYKMGQELITPKPHKHKDGGIDPVLNKRSLKWLKTRLGWAAEAIAGSVEEELTAALIVGFAAGESMEEIAQRIEGTFGPKPILDAAGNPTGRFTMDRTDRIARTEIMQASNYGNIEGYKEAGADEAEFMTSLDDVVCDTCDSMNGDIETVEDAEAILTLHPNCRCHTGNTLVIARDIERIYRRWYEGELIDITTAGGNKLSSTANHPILTDKGWLPANLLVEGDNVISRRVSQGMGTANPDIDNIPTSMSEIFESLAVMNLIEGVSSLPVDFHGDGREQQVDIITVNDSLAHRLEPASLKQYADFILSLTHREVSVTGSNGTLKVVSKPDSVSITHGAPGDISQPEPLFNDVAADTQVISNAQFGLSGNISPDNRGIVNTELTAQGDSNLLTDHSISSCAVAEKPTLFKDGNQAHIAYMVATGNNLSALPCDIVTDRIVNISKCSFTGHVYNLQTKSGSFFANNIISHNCVWLPVIPEGW